MKTVSSFEYAIMKAVHESQPEKVTKEDLESVRPETDAEVMQRKLNNEIDFLSRIKCRTPQDQDLMDKTIETFKHINFKSLE